jgi:2-keto-3-deoxy-L-rhamnonate aldolase RhmA
MQEASTNPVRRALQERRLTIGSWIQVGHATSAEVLAAAGFEWIAVDCEHTDIGLEACAAVMRGMAGSETVPFVRVATNDRMAIRQALDLGACGVIVPLVESAEEAVRAVRAAKYPPDGERGFSFHRANRHGADFDAHAARANADTAVVVMIETREGVEAVDEILAVDGVDGILVGPYDLSGSYGVPGDVAGEAVNTACARLQEACRRAGKSSGLHLVTPTASSVQQAVDGGFTFLALGMDTVFIAEGARAALNAVKR